MCFQFNNSEFPFSNILCEVINSRKQSHAVIKPRRESVEEFVNRYLREHVVKIWPDGWMKVEELLKEFDKRFDITHPHFVRRHRTFLSVSSRQLNNVKKSKESKKSVDSAQSQSSVMEPAKQSTSDVTTTIIGNTATGSNVTTSHSSLLNEVKSLLSANNSIVPNLKETSVTVVPSNKPDDTSSALDPLKTTTSPTFGNNLTITPIGVNDKVSSKPLASVQNQVNYHKEKRLEPFASFNTIFQRTATR